MHPDFLPTGRPIVGTKREWGSLPPSRRLGIGVVGLHEGHTMLVALRASGLCLAVAGCDLSAEKRAQAELASPGLWTTEKYEDLLARDDVKIVAIYTPDPLHAPQIEQAFKAGKHVICTKPLVNDLSVSEKLKTAAKEHGCRLQVGQSTRFYEPFQRQREDFIAGKVGEVEAVDAHYQHRMDWYYEKSPWTLDQTHWIYLGMSHPLDYLRWYLGPIKKVQAIGSLSALARKYGLKTPDIITVQVVDEQGRVGRAFSHFGCHELPKGRSLIEGFLMGSKGTSLARYPDLRYSYHDDRGVEIEEDFHHSMAGYYYRHELKGMHYGEFCSIADSFAAALISGQPNSPDLEEGLETVALMDAAYRALETGSTVEL